jgi:hypothetical protein
MEDRTKVALEATRRLRESPAFRGLSGAEQATLGGDLARIEQALRPAPAPPPRRPSAVPSGDPYAFSLATPADLQRELAGPGSASGRGEPAPPPAPPPPKPTSALDAFGRRTAEAVEAVNFPGFVAGLVTGTFQAIVDATIQQVREYADLVANLSRSVDDFARDNVAPDQVRGSLAQRFPSDLRIDVPAPGRGGEPRLMPAPAAVGQSPGWLEQFGLAGQELTAELTDGPLLDAARQRLAEERLQTLATMVLMGINRIVVNDGELRARMQFHAAAREQTDAEMMAAQISAGGIAGRSAAPPPSMMVSTVKANAQADASLKADLMGEVRISFRTETFPLERFADSAAIQLINRHARWKGDGAGTAAPTATEGSGGAAAPPGSPAPPPSRSGA